MTPEALRLFVVSAGALVAIALAFRRARTKARALLDSARDAAHSAQVAQRELEATHEKFAAFMANFPYPAFLQDERGVFVFVNQAGLASGEWREATASIEGSTRKPETLSVAHSDSHYFSIRFPLTIEGKVWLGGIAIDISERIRAERTLSERTADFETLFDNVPAPLWIARDRSGRQLVCNPAAVRLLGLPSGTRFVRPFDEDVSRRFVRDGRVLSSEQLPMQVCIAERRVVQGTDLEIVRPDGTRSHVRATAAPLLDARGDVRGAVAAALDISQLKEYETQLERAVRRRDEFLAVLAHELRNPLAPIRNSVEILQKAPTDVERVRRATATIDRQTSLLVRLIDDLLDVARVSQGLVELDLAPRTVGAVVTGAVEVARAEAPQTDHSIVIEHQDPDATVLVDNLRAEQIVVNLLSNAMKYSAPNTAVIVRSRIENGHAKIAVIDQGQGISKQFLSEIFTMFARPSLGERHRIGGLGVGLALAKQLAEQLGGGIDASSEGAGKGATFTVSFPLARATAKVFR